MVVVHIGTILSPVQILLTLKTFCLFPDISEMFLNGNTVFEEVFRKWLETVGNTINYSKYNSSGHTAKTIGENKMVIENFMYFVFNTRKKIGINIRYRQ